MLITLCISKMTRRKEKQKKKRSIESIYIRRAEEFISNEFVENVDNHFAGYYNELGITVKVIKDISDKELIKIRN